MMSPNIYTITVTDITGTKRSLDKYSGKVLLIVNVASKCGFTSQYSGLQELYEKFSPRGLVVCGFPSNDFGKQEPGTDSDIQKFCSLNYKVTFPMFSKVKVKGKEMHPLYEHLTNHNKYGGRILWNFSKFLINKSGEVAERFAPFTKPTSKRVLNALEKMLNQ